MKGRDILKSLTDAHKPQPQETGAPNKTVPRPSGSIRAMESQLDHITEQAAEAAALKESIEKEGQIVELDPSLVDAAAISDRIPTDIDPEFDELKHAIQTAGQQVPILVRPNPKQSGRYQAAYGHRRLRAAMDLGIQVKAIVRGLADDEMVLAQGQENGPRQDLSFIERALYASRLLMHGYDRDTVCNALGVDKPEVSRLLQVAENIETSVLMAIGPARKVGRPRWTALAKQLTGPKAQKRATTLLAGPAFNETTDSNKRFDLVFAETRGTSSKKEPAKKVLKGASGKKVGWVQDTRKGATFAFESLEFSEYLKSRLPDLLKEFEAEAEQPDSKLN